MSKIEIDIKSREEKILELLADWIEEAIAGGDGTEDALRLCETYRAFAEGVNIRRIAAPMTEEEHFIRKEAQKALETQWGGPTILPADQKPKSS